MTRSFFTSLFIALFLTQAAFPQGFNSIHSKNGTDVIAVGNSGLVFRSFDGGMSWNSFTLGSTSLNSVFCINNKIWIAGDNGVLRYSTDNGVNFSLSTISSQHLKSVFFVDENSGWIVGNNGTILMSVNGGLNWTLQTSPAAQNLNSVRFSNASSGVACGSNGTVIYTINSGANWLQYTTPTNKNLLSVDQKSNIIIATGEDGFIIKYSGSIWSTIDYRIVTKSEVKSVHMIDPNTFYTCGGGGFIRKSTDGGSNFIHQKNPMMGDLVSIFFYNSTSGWAVSSKNNAVLRTSDGGNTWLFPPGTGVTYTWVQKQATSGNIGNPFCLHPANKKGMFILAGSTLYRSLDKGETWTTLQTGIPGSSCHSFFVNAADTNLMVAAKGSSGGRIIRSTNYGATWTDVLNPINLTSYGMPLEADPNNPNTLFLGPDNQPMKISTDFGLTWNNLSGGEPGGVFRSPCDVVIQYDNSNIILVGDGTTGSGSGKFWKSTNGGFNWALINTVSGSEIPMIGNSKIDLNLVYHSTWSSGGFWKSTNSGSNFTLTSGPAGNLWAADIAKDDPNTVAYDQYGSTAYHSTDGGATFITTNVGSSPAAGILFYDKGNLLIQHGGGVYKLNVSYSVLTSNGKVSSEVPADYGLLQNYPNPFNPVTKIKFQIPKSVLVNLDVYDITGRLVAALVNEEKQPGNYEVEFDGSGIASGLYFYRLTAGSFSETRKMMIVK